MKKIKKLWQNNRVLFVLFTILIVCFFIIVGVTVKYFIGNHSSNYGDRLEETKKVKVTNEMKNDYQAYFDNDENIKSVKLNVTGKIIYITLNFENKITLVEAQSKAVQSLEKFSEDIQKVYDINFTLIQDKTDNNEGFTIMGAKNAKRPNIVWNNNTPIVEENE